MRYFLSGATGFIGGHLARLLVESGHEVQALVRTPAAADRLSALGVRLFKGDILEPATLRAPMEGCDGLFHLAAWYQVGATDDSMAHQVNVEGTRNVLQMMRDLEIPRGVYTSSLVVFGDTEGQVLDEGAARPQGPWPSVYDRTKHLAHYEVAEPMIAEGLPLIIVMPGLTYGPGDPSATGETLRDYLRGRLPMIPASGAFGWGHVEDIAAAHMLAMERGRVGESYIVAGPLHRLADVLEVAADLTGIPGPRIKLPRGAVRATASLLDPVKQWLPPLFRPETLRSAAATYLGSNEKARRELGYEPRPVEVGLRETLLYEAERLGIPLPAAGGGGASGAGS